MKTYFSDFIPKIARFSEKLDNLTLLTNHHWVAIGELNELKVVYIFRPNGDLLISRNGIVEKAKWEYLGNNSLLIETQAENYLFKHGFFDENILALRVDSKNEYAFLINETRFEMELNTLNAVLNFLEIRYKDEQFIKRIEAGIEPENREVIFGYDILDVKEKYSLAYGHFTEYNIRFSDGTEHEIYKGRSSGRFYYISIVEGLYYFDDFDVAARSLFKYLNKSWGDKV